MPLNRWLVFGALGLLLAGAGCPFGDAHAADRGRRGPERSHAEPAISLDEAVARAERRYKARAVRAEEKRHGDRIEYRIRLLGDDGRVFEVRIDAATGREN
jgi:uncharacterized membrane protein YkoI